jgi:hypothetical protein
MRAIMGENLRDSIGETRRREWIEHINSFVERRPDRPADGSYFDTHGHSALHGNGMVIGALGVLGGRQAMPVRLYEPFSTADKACAWLETIDWRRQWQASHLFWGGMVPFSLSARCPANWTEAVFAWLDANLDGRRGGGGKVSRRRTVIRRSAEVFTFCRSINIIAVRFRARNASSRAFLRCNWRTAAGWIRLTSTS